MNTKKLSRRSLAGIALTVGMISSAVLAQSAAVPPRPLPVVGAKHAGMTWQTLNKVIPGGALVGCNSKCDAYKGDTPAATVLPILCIVPGNSPEPAGYAAIVGGPTSPNAASSDWHFYYGWSGGKIGLTKPYPGKILTSRAVADSICKRELRDDKARMAEHHDNKVGGWSLGGEIHPNTYSIALLKNGGNEKQRFWVAINDQQANTWN